MDVMADAGTFGAVVVIGVHAHNDMGAFYGRIGQKGGCSSRSPAAKRFAFPTRRTTFGVRVS